MKRTSEPAKAGHGTKVDGQRRKVVKLIAASGVSAIASPWMFPTARAQGRPIKIGFVSPQTGPIAAFGEADEFILRGVRNALKDGLTIGGAKHPVTIVVKDSQSNPSRAAEVTRALIDQDKCDIITGSSTSTRPSRSPTSVKLPAFPASRPTRHGSHGSLGAAAIQPRASSGPITSSGGPAIYSGFSWICGARSRPIRLWAGFGAMTPTALRSRTRREDSLPRSRKMASTSSMPGCSRPCRTTSRDRLRCSRRKMSRS